MNIQLITTDKKRFLSLLLLADEQESMLDRYLEREICSSCPTLKQSPSP